MGAEQELARHPVNSAAYRVCLSLSKALPGMPELVPYLNLPEAAAALRPELGADEVEAARALLTEDWAQRALTLAQGLDAEDAGMSVITGVRSVFGLLFGGDKSDRLVDEGQQRTDAVIKVLALSWLVSTLQPGLPLTALPAAQTLLQYYGAVEIALPFGDEVAAAEGHFVASLVSERMAGISGKLTALLGAAGFAVAQEGLDVLLVSLDATSLEAVGRLDAIVSQVRGVVPLLGGSAATELAATGVDALPVYRLLVSRWIVEAALERAVPAAAAPEAPMAAGSNPFAAPEAAPTEAANPFAAPEPETPSVAGSNPFSAPEAVPAEAANPFAAPEAAPTPAPASPSLPTPVPPVGAAEQLDGAYTDGQRWWVFSIDGFATDTPPADPPPHDWAAHLAAGHRVLAYRRQATALTLDGGSLVLGLEQYALVLGGIRWARADFDLSGRTLDGSWSDDHGGYRLSADGRFARLPSPIPDGRYQLGRGSIQLDYEDGRHEVLGFFSTLQPSSQAPDVVWVGGRHLRRECP